MKLKDIGITLACLMAGMLAGSLLRQATGSNWREATGERSQEKEVVVDTIVYYKPIAKDSTVVKYVVKTLPMAMPGAMPVADKSEETGHIPESGEMVGDSADVMIPIEQKVYESQDYKAWVSGYMARLDSISVYRATETLRIQKAPKRWHIGLTAGYGYSPQGFAPYVGIGITYSLFGY